MSQPTFNQATHVTTQVGSTGLAIPSTQAGMNTNESYLGLKSFPPIPLSNTTPTALPNVTSGIIYVTNPLGNAYIAVGGLAGTNDAPSFTPGTSNAATGTRVAPNGQPVPFRITNGSSLSAIAQRNGDIIEVQADLAGTNFTTPTSTLAPNPLSLPPFAIVSTTPANNATGVPEDVVINVLFNRALGPSSLGPTDVTLVPAIPGAQVYIDPNNSSQVDIDPKGSPLTPDGVYTVTMNAPGFTDMFGNDLTTPYTFSFQISGIPAPTVTNVTPGSNQTGISTGTNVVVAMSVPVSSSTVNTSNVQLVQVGGSAVSANVSLASDGQTITISPTSALANSTQYKVVIQNLQNTQFLTQSPNPWDGVSQNNAGTFTTAAPNILTVSSVTPGNAATNVSVAADVVVVMNIEVQSSTVNTTNVKLETSGGTTVTSTVSLGPDNMTITITPSADLAFDTEYKVVLSNLVSLSGSITISPNPWDGISVGPNSGAFTTEVALTVSSVTPGNNAGGVAINATISVVMNEEVISGGVNSSNIQLIQVSNSSVVSSTVALQGDGMTIIIDPSANLSYSTQYKVVVKNLQSFADDVTQSPNPWDGVSQSNAGTFTTTAQTFTQRYNVSQSSNPCSNNSVGYGPATDAICVYANGPGNGALGTNQFNIGVAYGEKASSSNGLTTAPIVKVIIAVVAGADSPNSNPWGNSVPTGKIGIKIINSSGTVKYTFTSTFTASSTGYGSICTVSCNSGEGSIYGWTNITLEDTGNTYTMVAGDYIMITWSGTGNNVIAIGHNASGPYGVAAYQTGSGGSPTSVSGADIAMTCYSTP